MSAKTARSGGAALALAMLVSAPTLAQQQPTEPSWPQPMNNNPLIGYAILKQNELRTGAGGTTYRWDGEGWYGGNLNRAWFTSEGNLDTDTGRLGDGEVQALYSRAVTAFFDLQTGVRYNFGNMPPRGWGVIGIEGLAPYFFEVNAHAYLGSGGHLAARIEASYDFWITQRLVLQPQFETNFYSKDDPRRGLGSGLSDIDSGLRLRYEITRQFAPYIGVTYEGKFAGTADLARAAGERPHQLRFVFGVRTWF